MKVTDDEVKQIRRLAKSPWVLRISDALLHNLDEEAVARIMGSYLYMKADGRPDKDFLGYLASRELWTLGAIGLNTMGAAIPAMIFDEEFRTLAIKTAMAKGSEVAASSFQSRIATSGLEAGERKTKD